jgi:hypothetical protein
LRATARAGGPTSTTRFSIESASGRSGPASASGSAVLALDEALQPAGAGTLRVVGAGAVLDAATRGGLLPQRNAGATRLVLRMMERLPPEGGPPVLEVPLTLEERTLSLARFPLLRLPALEWWSPAPLPSTRGGPRPDPALPMAPARR